MGSLGFVIEYILHWVFHTRIVKRFMASHTHHHSSRPVSDMYYPWAITSRKQHLEYEIGSAIAAILFFYYGCWELFLISLYTCHYNIMHQWQHRHTGTIVYKYHVQHHRNANTHIGVCSPLVDIIRGTMSKRFKLRSPAHVLLLPFPVVTFWAVEEIELKCHEKFV